MPLPSSRLHALQQEYLPVFWAMGMSASEAWDSFKALLDRAEAMSAEKGIANLDARGLVALAERKPGVQAELEWRISEGVTEEDFRWWWDMPDVERQIIMAVDEMQIIGYYEAVRKSGVNKEEAAESVKRAHVRFTEFTQLNDFDPRPEHRCLPVELKQRVIKYIERQMKADPSGQLLRKRVHAAGSANANIREEIRLGNL